MIESFILKPPFFTLHLIINNGFPPRVHKT